jgi:hypothetical protein
MIILLTLAAIAIAKYYHLDVIGTMFANIFPELTTLVH